MMDEPSVLDYVKAKLTFWKKSDLFIPDPDDAPVDWAKLSAEEAQNGDSEAEIATDGQVLRTWAMGFPWLAILPLVFALFAQEFIEPPVRYLAPAIVLYGLAAVLIGIALWKHALVLVDAKADVPPEARTPDDLQAAWMVSVGGIVLGILFFLVKTRSPEDSIALDVVRAVLATLTGVAGFWVAWLGGRSFASENAEEKRSGQGNLVILALVLILLAFLMLGGNRFNSINFLLWFASMATSGLLVFRIEPRAILKKFHWGFPQIPAIKFSTFTILLIVVIIIVGLFRFTNLNGLPGDMFSDHAEKLLDVNDLMSGQFKIFFERNTGREMFQFYWTALMGIVFSTGISFMSLKIGTALVGVVTLYYIYRLGDEVGGKWVALYALFFAGIAYWPNVISRIGLRFPLYPFCVAPVMFYLLRGLRRKTRNDFVWAGIWLGIGLHGYTASRIVPLLVLVAFGLYGLHQRKQGNWKETLAWLLILSFTALVIFLPLYRYALDTPEMFAYRTLTRLGSVERPLPGSPIMIFLSNTWNAIIMFFWDNGDVWVHSIPHRPALALVDAVLFFFGFILVTARYIRKMNWRDLFLLLSIPILLLPSILALAFPNENPNLNRTAGAYVPVFIILALGLDALLSGVRKKVEGQFGTAVTAVIASILLIGSLGLNADLFFNQYASEYNQSIWNTAEMGQVMQGFSEVTGTSETTWVVGYPYWVDTRLVAINAGYPDRNPEIRADAIKLTTPDPRAKLFMLNTADTPSLDILRVQYPQGRFWLHKSPIEGKDFILYMVPADVDTLP